MSRRRDHRARWDTTPCPDPDGCTRLFHGSPESGMVPGDTCECCGQTWDPDTISTRAIELAVIALEAAAQACQWGATLRNKRHLDPLTPRASRSRCQIEEWAQAHRSGDPSWRRT